MSADESNGGHRPGQSSGTVMLVLAWIVGLGLVGWWFDDYLEGRYNPNQSPVTVRTDGAAEIRLQRNRGNAYVLGGHVNGQRVTFLVDTGATQVAVPEHLAERLGLSRGRSVSVGTANGSVRAWTSRIDTLELGDITLYDVEALINPGMRDNEILLGMSALRHLEFLQRGDELILRTVP